MRTFCSAGIGVASQIVVTYLNIYYIVVLAWAIFYLFYAFQSPVPWSTCDNWWNTCDACADSSDTLFLHSKNAMQCNLLSVSDLPPQITATSLLTSSPTLISTRPIPAGPSSTTSPQTTTPRTTLCEWSLRHRFSWLAIAVK